VRTLFLPRADPARTLSLCLHAGNAEQPRKIPKRPLRTCSVPERHAAQASPPLGILLLLLYYLSDTQVYEPPPRFCSPPSKFRIHARIRAWLLKASEGPKVRVLATSPQPPPKGIFLSRRVSPQSFPSPSPEGRLMVKTMLTINQRLQRLTIAVTFT